MIERTSHSLREVRFSGHREISFKALTVPGAIRLEVGQPDFETPLHIREAAKQAIDDGWNFYTPTTGIAPLRERLALKLQRINEIEVSPDRVMCGHGGSGVIAAALAAICDPGDEVLVPDPGWPQHQMAIAAVQGRSVPYPCPPGTGFLPDLAAMESLVTPRTRALIVNSPNNPTGAIYPQAVLADMARLAERHQLWILSDECYDQIVFDGEPVAPSIWSSGGEDRVIACFSFSKSYSMCGWRIGYGVIPPLLLDSVAKATEAFTSGACAVSQKAAEAALDGPQECVEEMVSAYRRRRDMVAGLLRTAGMLAFEPAGSFYVLADISATQLESTDLCHRLLDECGVAVAPGSAFGRLAAGTVRISLASSDEDLRAGVGRLCELVGSLRTSGSNTI